MNSLLNPWCRHSQKTDDREVADKISDQPWHSLPVNPYEERRLILDWIKIGLTFFAIVSMWLIFFLRQSGPVEVRPTQGEKLPVSTDSEKVEVISF